MLENNEKYIYAMREMFRTNGWKILLEDLSKNAKNINSVEYVKDNEDLSFRKGQLDILRFIDLLETQVDNLANEENL